MNFDACSILYFLTKTDVQCLWPRHRQSAPKCDCPSNIYLNMLPCLCSCCIATVLRNQRHATSYITFYSTSTSSLYRIFIYELGSILRRWLLWFWLAWQNSHNNFEYVMQSNSHVSMQNQTLVIWTISNFYETIFQVNYGSKLLIPPLQITYSYVAANTN